MKRVTEKLDLSAEEFNTDFLIIGNLDGLAGEKLKKNYYQTMKIYIDDHNPQKKHEFLQLPRYNINSKVYKLSLLFLKIFALFVFSFFC